MRRMVVTPIREGTVIDHIPSGRGILVFKMFSPKGRSALISNVESKKMGKKDIVKFEGVFLTREEYQKIALIAPNATINIIEDYKVKKKEKVVVPSFIEGILKCPNPKCITNNEPQAKAKFFVEKRDPLVLRCFYCERRVESEEIAENLVI